MKIPAKFNFKWFILSRGKNKETIQILRSKAKEENIIKGHYMIINLVWSQQYIEDYSFEICFFHFPVEFNVKSLKWLPS